MVWKLLSDGHTHAHCIHQLNSNGLLTASGEIKAILKHNLQVNEIEPAISALPPTSFEAKAR